MTDCTLDTSVVDWIIDHPESMPVFVDLGIDCSCGGKSLEYACLSAGLVPAEVLARLQKEIESGRSELRDS